MTKSMFCGALLILLARYRTPQVVLLTEQSDPSQNGVYEVLPCEPATTLARVGDPSRAARAVRLGAGWAVSEEADEHGFCPVVQVLDMRTTEPARITHDPDVCGGVPCVRGLRIPVAVVLRHLADGKSAADIVAELPELDAEDVAACVAYAEVAR